MHTQQQDGISVEGSDIRDVRRKVGLGEHQRPFFTITPINPKGGYAEYNNINNDQEDIDVPLPLEFRKTRPTDCFRVTWNNNIERFTREVKGLEELIKLTRSIFKMNVDSLKMREKLIAKYEATRKEEGRQKLIVERANLAAQLKEIDRLIYAQS